VPGSCRSGRNLDVNRAEVYTVRWRLYQLTVWIILPPECPTNRNSDFLYKGPNQPFKRCVCQPCAHFHLVTLYPTLSQHQMFSSALLASLFLFFGLAAAGQIIAPACTVPSWSWVCMLSLPCIFGRYLICWHCVQTYNSLGQNPCTVAAYLLSTCNQGCELFSCLHEPCCLISFAAYTLKALQGPDYDYAPSSPSLSDLCQCNTVTYSLLSACEACQGAKQELTYDSHCPLSKSLGLCI
jgi:hypothetical protein